MRSSWIRVGPESKDEDSYETEKDRYRDPEGKVV